MAYTILIRKRLEYENQKMIKCGIVGLTRIKEIWLSEEYENLNKFLIGDENVESIAL